MILSVLGIFERSQACLSASGRFKAFLGVLGSFQMFFGVRECPRVFLREFERVRVSLRLRMILSCLIGSMLIRTLRFSKRGDRAANATF